MIFLFLFSRGIGAQSCACVLRYDSLPRKPVLISARCLLKRVQVHVHMYMHRWFEVAKSILPLSVIAVQQYSSEFVSKVKALPFVYKYRSLFRQLTIISNADVCDQERCGEGSVTSAWYTPVYQELFANTP